MALKPTKATDRDKAWNRRKKYNNPYNIASRALNRSFLIICEGKNTEVEYLRSIPAPNAIVKVEGGFGSKTALVKKALEFKKKKEYQDYEIWCIYDMDYRGEQVGQKEDFNESIELAKRNGMHVGYSNDSFELWFVLHYRRIEQSFLRFDYYRILNELWAMSDYEEEGKKKGFCRHIYDLLQNDPKANESHAIERAKQLFFEKIDMPFADQNPCTTVYQLVELLQGGA